MAKKVIEKMGTETSDLKIRNRTLTRRLNEAISEKNHEVEQRQKIQNRYFKTQAAVCDQKAQEMCSAVSFYAAHEKSVVWDSVDSDDVQKYMKTVEFECYPVLQKNHYAFLPPGVDICVTVRDNAVFQDIQHVLRQIAEAIHIDNDIAYFREDDDSFEYQVEVVNGIFLAE